MAKRTLIAVSEDPVVGFALMVVGILVALPSAFIAGDQSWLFAFAIPLVLVGAAKLIGVRIYARD